MEKELLEQLGSKIDSLLDELELLRMEVSELRTERDNLLVEKNESSERVQALLSRFDSLNIA
ncbi:cell division protein ZapB [Pontibacterium granulatum]|uniref:cell division protein ZapB n=1 Tax=Pontibacterium granulatum TaxID=2036029 RepID=UPI00249A7E59|nr:cell division protein ZapB [Pontibacterium granulatum]MDI3323897.1 cell division protein ZapB [Pontibacterium granulatum]